MEEASGQARSSFTLSQRIDVVVAQPGLTVRYLFHLHRGLGGTLPAGRRQDPGQRPRGQDRRVSGPCLGCADRAGYQLRCPGMALVDGGHLPTHLLCGGLLHYGLKTSAVAHALPETAGLLEPLGGFGPGGHFRTNAREGQPPLPGLVVPLHSGHHEVQCAVHALPFDEKKLFGHLRGGVLGVRPGHPGAPVPGGDPCVDAALDRVL
ncbi:unnamed protein product, partial [Effrenium voratum]